MALLIVKILASLVALAAAKTQGKQCHVEDETSFLQISVTHSATGEDEMEVGHGAADYRNGHKEVDQLWPQSKTQLSSCKSIWGTGGEKICPQDIPKIRTEDPTTKTVVWQSTGVVGQNCGKLVDLPDGHDNPLLTGSDKSDNYDFYESASWVPGMEDDHGNFAYVPATRCIARSKIGRGYYDDPTCADQTTTDIYKVYPRGQGTHFQGPLTMIPAFKAFGSKVTHDGKYLFICDLDHSRIIAIDMHLAGDGGENQGLAMVVKNPNPNDIAIWESPAGALKVFAAAGGASTNVYSATLGIRKNKGTTGELEFVVDADDKHCARSADKPMENGCDFKKLPDMKLMASKMKATPAGIGVSTSFGASEPDVWIATLGYFGLLKRDMVKWGLFDPSWGTNFHCTLPTAYSGANNKGLIDNVVMVDSNTMIAAIYTECNHDPGICLSQNYTSFLIPDFIKNTNSMFSKKNVDYNVVAFTRVCLNKVSDGMLVDKDKGGWMNIAGASKTFLYPLPDNQKGDDVFNGRVTHIQNVGDDLMAINYQFNKVMVFEGVMNHIRCPTE